MFDDFEKFLEVMPGKLIYADKSNYIKISNLGKEYCGLIIFDILDESEIEIFKKQLNYAKSSKSGCEYVTFKEKSFKKWYKNTIRPTFDNLGRFESYSFYQEDITEKKILEQRIFETQFIYYEAFRAIGIGVWEYNSELNIFNISNTLKKMLNLKTNVISFQKWQEIVHKDDWQRIQEELQETINFKQNTLLVTNYRVYVAKDKFIWINSTGKSTKFNSDGFAFKFLGIVQNITSQVEAKEKLKRYSKELEQEVQKRTKELEITKKEAEKANVAKSEFLSNISHEFFTPLNIILNSVSIIERKLNDNSDTQKILNNIKTSGENLNTLVKNMLYLAKLDLDNIKFKFYKTDMISLLNSLILEIKNKYNITIQTEISTPIRYIFCDSMNIKMVLLELINNSIKYNKSEPLISLKIISDKKNIVFNVTDNGVGINEDEISLIFNRFYTIDNHFISNLEHGRGLGLSICKDIISKHKGEIWAKNNKEDGLTVTFTLPILGEDNVQ